jgi:hypothetical protein
MPLTSVGGTTYTYGNNGNVTAMGSLHGGLAKPLAAPRGAAAVTTSYGYGHTGQRVFKAPGAKWETKNREKK